MKNLLKILSLIIIYKLSCCSYIFASQTKESTRERISINNDWRFYKYPSSTLADPLIYDVRPAVTDNNDSKAADSKPTEAVQINTNSQPILKPWILPTGNAFINDPSKRYKRPEGNPGENFPFVQSGFNDQNWELINLPHDWAIKGPFQEGSHPEVGGGMGRLPVNGVAWYRKKIDIPASDTGKCVFLDIDGAMSYAMVWLNGKLVGGWPYGYNSWRVDLTPYILAGKANQLAIRVDNPNYSARWYPGAGIYRNVWLVKTSPIHVSQYGTTIISSNVSKEQATINLQVNIENKTLNPVKITQTTEIFSLDAKGTQSTKAIACFDPESVTIGAGVHRTSQCSVIIRHPQLWGPYPTQKPNLYMAVTKIVHNGKIIDTYETRFGIRTIEFDKNRGILINGEHIAIKGVCQHHDLGAIGSAFNTRAAERQLEILQNMGCNAIRMTHNPPAPELLELTDRMGFLVLDEIFDSWELKKTPHDFHLIYPEWSEQDVRSFIRRDRNCPSIFMWCLGNEAGEQYTGEAGAKVAARLRNFIREEDPTRPVTSGMNYAKPDMALPNVLDIIGLNYQGEGIRMDPQAIATPTRCAPQYDAFRAKFPDKLIISTETASAASSRGCYLFPVSPKNSDVIRDNNGGDSQAHQVSGYELYAVDFGSSAEKVFGSLEHHPFVAGEFVWTGFDYIGEPTPYYEARSSYTGIIDLAGFPKDRYYLYQAHWRPDFPMAHILPHWNWPDRIGKITPVHVFTSGDEAELFLNGQSLGRRKKNQYEYRLRWDSVYYSTGALKVIAYKNGQKWAEDIVQTTETASKLVMSADKNIIQADGKDLSFITIKVCDNNGQTTPTANHSIRFSIEGPGDIVGTDNGDATDMTSFGSNKRNAFNGLCLVIVKAKPDKRGDIILKAQSPNLQASQIIISSR